MGDGLSYCRYLQSAGIHPTWSWKSNSGDQTAADQYAKHWLYISGHRRARCSFGRRQNPIHYGFDFG